MLDFSVQLDVSAAGAAKIASRPAFQIAQDPRFRSKEWTCTAFQRPSPNSKFMPYHMSPTSHRCHRRKLCIDVYMYTNTRVLYAYMYVLYIYILLFVFIFLYSCIFMFIFILIPSVQFTLVEECLPLRRPRRLPWYGSRPKCVG